MSGVNLIETLRERFGIKSDAALARELDTRPSDICKVRRGGTVGPTLILSIHEHLGVPVKDIRELVK